MFIFFHVTVYNNMYLLKLMRWIMKSYHPMKFRTVGE